MMEFYAAGRLCGGIGARLLQMRGKALDLPHEIYQSFLRRCAGLFVLSVFYRAVFVALYTGRTLDFWAFSDFSHAGF